MVRQTSKKAYVSGGNACPEKLLSCGRVHKYLVQNGWDIEDSPEEADLILFSACGHLDVDESDSLARIKDFQALAKAGSRLIVWGCLTKIHPEALQATCKGPYLDEPELLSQIDDLTRAEVPIAGITNNEIYSIDCVAKASPVNKLGSLLKSRLFPGFYGAKEQLNLYRPGDPSIFYMDISTGCLDHCTYCVEPVALGTVKSKPLETVVAEFKNGLGAGYREFSLMGTDQGCYGYDRGYTLCDLLERLTEEKADYKIGIRNINPAFMKQLIDGLERILKTGKIWFIGLPAESGSNRILKLMGRRYTMEQYREYCQRLKAAWPELVIRNQMLVGFPTETEQDFVASLKLLQEIEIDYNEIYPFSGRPGTIAYDLSGQLPRPLIKSRYYRMLTREVWKHSIRKAAPPRQVRNSQTRQGVEVGPSACTRSLP